MPKPRVIKNIVYFPSTTQANVERWWEKINAGDVSFAGTMIDLPQIVTGKPQLNGPTV